VESTLPSGTTKRRVELRIVRPVVTWWARPTVTIDGVGHPAQWGVGTWALPADGTARIGVYLFNRVWRFGAASVAVSADDAGSGLEYRAGVLPIGRGELRRDR
jgi:hypothetical protein